MPDGERCEVMRLLVEAGGAHAHQLRLLGRLLQRKWRAPCSMHMHMRMRMHMHMHMHVCLVHMHMHVCASQVRALDATCRESDSAKGWNPLYALAGRHVSQYGA